MTGDYCGEGTQRLCVKLRRPAHRTANVTINGHPAETAVEGGRWTVLLPAAPVERPCHVEIQ